MSDLIDRAELIKALNKVAMEHHESNVPMVEHDFRELIHQAEAVDAVKVVRCKDCKWWKDDECTSREIFIVDDEEYCAYGERKEQGDER